MIRRFCRAVLLVFALVSHAFALNPLLPVGVARVDITPPEPIRLCGYSERSTPFESVAERLRACALAIGGGDANPSVLITAELIGAPADIVEPLAERLKAKAGIARENLVVCATHTHTGPVLSAFLKGAHFPEPLPADEIERVRRYETWLIDQLEKVALEALHSRQPARLAWCQGRVTFAANRRFIQNGKYAGMRATAGPVDHALPMLTVTDAQGALRAVLTNYACHCTTYAPKFNHVHGDWAGAAARMIEERHPGSTALIAIGCGADANPNPRGAIDGTEMVDAHGRAVADEIDRLLAGPQAALAAAPAGALSRIELPFDHVPTRDELEQRIAAGKRPANYARILIDRLDRGEKLPASFSYPVQTWVFGSDLAMIFLSGEVLVDYSLRLKRELDGSRLWITAYANDTPGYIASRRVIAEGGYEVDDSMNNYDKPTRLALVAEDLIVNAAKQLTPLPFFESGGATFQRMEWKVGDVTREALVRFPPKAKTGTAPLLFVWHGYGGTMRAAVSFLPMFAHWPDAIVVHAQGLPVSRTVGGVEVTKPGWQLEPGEFADRDVKFFDAMLDTFLREHRVDAKRVFSTGHSNGGRFTQILWAERGDKHAAVAPSGTFVEAWLDRLTAKPCLHLAGEKDSQVPFARQLRMIDALLTINGCEASGEPWLPLNPGSTTRYPSSQGTPLVTIIHPGGHEFPSGAAELITTFFKQCLP